MIEVVFSTSRTRSISEPSDTGTLIADPKIRPDKLGSTLPMADAAPVYVGTMFIAQALPRRSNIPFLCVISNVA